jgi:trehalose synthase
VSGARAHIGTDSGEVAQIARTLLPYWRGAGIDVRWMVLRGSREFFRVTKRFHDHLQGEPGDRDVPGVTSSRRSIELPIATPGR